MSEASDNASTKINSLINDGDELAQNEENAETVSVEDLIDNFQEILDEKHLQPRMQLVHELGVGLSSSRCTPLSRPQTRSLVGVLVNAVLHAQVPAEPAFRSQIEQLLGRLVATAPTKETYQLISQVSCVYLSGEIQQLQSRSQQAAALRLACLVLKDSGKTGQLESLPEWALKLIRAICLLLAQLGGQRHSAKFRKLAERQITSLWRACPGLLDACLDHWLSTPECRAISWQALRCAACHCAQLQTLEKNERVAPIKAKLLEFYVAETFNAKVKPDQEILESFHTLLNLVTAEEYDILLHSVVEKSLKKNPEAAMPLVESLIKALNFDLGRHLVGSFLSPILRQLRSAKDEIRVLAFDLLAALSKRCADTDALKTAAEEIGGVLHGKAGVMAQWYQRLGTVAGLRALRSGVLVLDRSLVAPVAVAATTALMPILQKEAHEQTRALAFVCLGEWVSNLDLIAQDLLKILSDDVCQVDVVRAIPPLLAVCEMCKVPALRSQLQPLLDSLVKVIAGCAAKPNQANQHGLLALYSAICIASTEGSSSALSKKIPWEVLKMGDSFAFSNTLFSPQARTPIGEVDVLSKALAALCAAVSQTVCNFPSSELVSEQSEMSEPLPAFTAVVKCLLHPTESVRAAAEVACQEIGMPEEMFAALWGVVKRMTEEQEAQRKESAYSLPSKEDVPALLLSVPHPNRVAKALRTILSSSSKHLGSSRLPHALVLAHHPACALSDRTAEHIWSGVQEMAFGGYKEVVGLLEDPAIAAEVSEELMQAMSSCLPAERKAGCRSLATLAGDCGEVGFVLASDGVVPGMLLRLQHPDFTELSARDINIYFCPEGTLYSTIRKKHEVTDNKNAERRRTKTGKRGNVYDAEDEEWELEFKKKQEEKKKGGSSVPDEEAKLLAEESEIRRKVGLIRQNSLSILESIGWIYNMNSFIGQLTITEALPILLKLLESPLLAEAGYRCLIQLAGALDPILADWALESSGAVRIVHLNEDPKLAKAAAESKVVYKVLSRVSKEVLPLYSAPKPLAPASFFFIFPILKATLINPPTSASAQQAVGIIAAHAVMPEDDEEACGSDHHSLHQNLALRVLRKRIIAIVLHAIRTLPKIEPSPAKVLTTVCTGPALTSTEWAPLFGDDGLLSDDDNVRICCLDTIMAVAMEGSRLQGNPLLESRLWLMRHDENAEVVELAEDIWDSRGEDLSPMYSPLLLTLLGHDRHHVRQAAGKALAGAVKIHTNSLSQLIDRLLALYATHKPEEKTQDENSKLEAFFARPPGQEEEPREAQQGKWQARSGVALTLKALGDLQSLAGAPGHTESILHFLVFNGICDEDDMVRKEMTEAGIALISAFGETQSSFMLNLFERTLGQQHQSNESVKVFDFRREGLVVFLGRCANFLDPENPKIESIVATLIEALSTPSEAVQKSVADCLGPLLKIPAIKARGSEYLQQLLVTVAKGERYGDRRGAAYGVAAIVKGLGISTLKKESVISKLEEACQSGQYTSKQGALFTFECLCLRLGMLFEPYIIVILPLLLKCFSDSSDHVREAAFFSAQAIMGNLSQHGVKLVLPAILKSLEDKAWRTKQAAILLLGSMANCAPRQLGQCLPQIVPKLTESFADTHPKVKEAGKQALSDIGKVISNPEVSRLSSVLLAALTDPANKTADALQSMLQCEFLHAIDAPSLALLVPVMRRGLKSRSAEAKKKAALITGNMCQMVADAKDLLPYLDGIVPSLQEVLLDPVPDVRATAAKALGSMMKSIGEEHLEGLVPWLITTLKCETSPVERSGGAQGLAEVLSILGMSRVFVILDELLPLHKHPNFGVREGLLWLLSFLPATLGTDYSSVINRALPVILSGLADDTESVRSVAMTAAQVLVNTNGKIHSELLLPALEAGLFDGNWRIRQSSVTLLGDLIYLLGGIKAEELGLERRHSLLASLYIIRSDVSAVVRQVALQAWKDLVHNTPKTLREIMSALINQIVVSLSSPDVDRRTVAGRALGDLVKKLGEQVLPEIVPFLREGLEKGNETTRQGVCLGLSEILECANKKQIEDFIGTLVPAVQEALCDESEDVREQAAAAFQILHQVVGARATEEVIPSLLKELRREGVSNQKAIFGLKEVLRLRPRELLTYLIPKMVVHPMQPWQARVMVAVAQSTPATIHYYIQQILPEYILELSNLDSAKPGSDEAFRKEEVQAAYRALVASVDTVGVNFTISELATHISSPESVLSRKYGIWGLEQFLVGTKSDFTQQIPVILRDLLQRMHESDEGVLLAMHSALQALNRVVKPEELVKHLEFCRTLLSSLVSDKRWKGGVGEGQFLLNGTNLPKGLEPLLPMYQQGLMYGSPQLREVAATGLGELVDVTSAEALKPFLVKITGPLIRIVGDRFPAGVKAAILQTLGLLLGKGGVLLKPFVPQLQTTFVKALSDPASNVRQQGARALSGLMQIAARVDPLVTELLGGAVSGTPVIKVTMLQALQGVLANSSAAPSATVLAQAADTLRQLISEEDEGSRAAAATALGAVAKFLDEDSLESLMSVTLLGRGSSMQANWLEHHGRSLALAWAIKMLPATGTRHIGHFLDQVLTCLLGDASNDRLPIKLAACKGFGNLVLVSSQLGGMDGPAAMILERIIPSLINLIDDSSAEARKSAVVVIKCAAKLYPQVTRTQLDVIIPALLKVVRDSNIQTKLASERALMHILEIHSRNETLNEFVMTADSESARFVKDYSKRVLVRLSADSGDEAEF